MVRLCQLTKSSSSSSSSNSKECRPASFIEIITNAMRLATA